MDRRVKERLIGAGILGALVVAIVPELLSGPKPAATNVFPPPDSAPASTRTITVPVDAFGSEPAAPETSAPPSPAASAIAQPPPVKAQESPAAPLENPPPAPTNEPRMEPSTPSTPSAPPAPSVGGRTSVAPTGAWAVQLGSFASKANAEKLAHELSGKGLSPYVSSNGSGTAVRYRVRVGPFVERAEAERALAKLKSQGLAATLAPPSGP